MARRERLIDDSQTGVRCPERIIIMPWSQLWSSVSLDNAARNAASPRFKLLRPPVEQWAIGDTKTRGTACREPTARNNRRRPGDWTPSPIGYAEEHRPERVGVVCKVLRFLFVDEHLVDINDDLVDYEKAASPTHHAIMHQDVCSDRACAPDTWLPACAPDTWLPAGCSAQLLQCVPGVRELPGGAGGGPAAR